MPTYKYEQKEKFKKQNFSNIKRGNLNAPKNSAKCTTSRVSLKRA